MALRISSPFESEYCCCLHIPILCYILPCHPINRLSSIPSLPVTLLTPSLSPPSCPYFLPSPISTPRSLDVLSLIAKVLFLTDEQLEVVGLKVPSKNIFTTIISSFTPVEPKTAADIEVSEELSLLLCLSVPYFYVIIYRQYTSYNYYTCDQFYYNSVQLYTSMTYQFQLLEVLTLSSPISSHPINYSLFPTGRLASRTLA